MTFEEILPYVEIASFIITVLVIVYAFGKWRQRSETDKEELKRRLDVLSAKIDKVPQEFLPVFIDLYKRARDVLYFDMVNRYLAKVEKVK